MPQAGIGFDTLDTGYHRKTGATFIVRYGEEKAKGKREHFDRLSAVQGTGNRGQIDT
ncbi:MAG: hypothetical protein HLUCCO16_03685 [Phormidium sp. OSCR]|nr:MAG: hypothetical protein HLUCCO16_03685 [Phormidium sp. OSCR]